MLTEVCETVLKAIDGFLWLTHRVNYSNFSGSLKVVCVFGTNDQLSAFTTNNDKKALTSLIEMKLIEIDVKFKNMENHILFDTEENCTKEHNGNLANRLS